MPDNAILNQMLDRLYASLMSGPSLNCRPHSSRQRIDLLTLHVFEDRDPSRVIPELLSDGGRSRIDAKVDPPPQTDSAVRFDSEHADEEAGDSTSNEPSAELRAAQRAWQQQRSILTKLRNLGDDARTYEQDTGVSVLSIGYPLLSIPPTLISRGSRRVLAPLAFIPVAMEVQAGRKAGVTLTCRESGADRLIPNEALLAWLERETGEGFATIADDEAGEQPWVELRQIIEAVTSRLGLTIDIKALVDPDRLQLVRAPRADDLPNEQIVLPAAVLGMFPLANQGLLRDTRDLIAEPQLTGPITSFLSKDAILEPTEHGMPDEEPLVAAGVRDFEQEHLITLADPFQSRAVTLAKSTLGLVVHGPPGTGKSQTITNIIGDHLARGERVLFVCDKRTAIDVVARRLEHLGLGDLYAVVHDPQRDQRDLYMAVRGRLENLVDTPVPARAESKLRRINKELKEVHAELTQAHAALMGDDDDETSLHDCMGRWASIDAEPLEGDAAKQIELLTLEQFESHRADIELLLERAEAIGYAANPWSQCLGVKLEAFLDRPVDAMRQSLASCLENARAVDATLDERIPPFSAGEPIEDQIKRRQRIGKRLAWLHGRGEADVMQRVASLDAKSVRKHIERLTEATPYSETFAAGPLDSELRLATAGSLPALAQLNQAIGDITDYIEAGSKWYGFLLFGAKSRGKKVARQYGLRLTGEEATRLRGFLVVLRARLVLSDVIRQIAGHEDASLLNDEALQATLDQYEQALTCRALADGDKHLAETVQQALTDTTTRSDLLAGLEKSTARGEALGTLERSITGADLFDGSWFDRASGFFRSGREAVPTMQRVAEKFDDAESVARVRDTIDRLPAALQQAVRQVAESGDNAEASADRLNKAVLAGLIAQRINADPHLRRLDGDRIESFIDRYQQLELDKQTAVRNAILHRWRSKQKARLLASTGSRLNGEGADLRRRLYVRGKRAMRLRQVINVGQSIEGGDPMFDLCPVWMASPETVAQVFPREPMFNVVVFDEASQCRLEEALPVLTRAKRVVVAGDPKQLPPTRFFEAAITTSETDDYETDQDLFEAQQTEVEDLLSAALNLEVEEAYLDVHYRSRNADLIEFSNEQFYHSRLQAIPGHPSNRAKFPPLSLERVDGVYDERSNRPEAERVVQIVDDLLRRAEPPSIGIACFNLKQRDLIADVLEDKAIDDADFAKRLAAARTRRGDGSFEGLFVKNLENVQGDERDHIIISTTYGPTKEGKFYRRFGPLGRAGGGRRLNVLVTRARHEVHLVTSIPREVYSQADAIPDGMAPNGGWLLFAYLRYAEALAAAYEESETDHAERQRTGAAQVVERHVPPASSFGLALAHTLLRERGIGSDAHWGNTGFCIDLALHHPRLLDDVTAGVLCDFARYPGCPDPVEWEAFRTSILRWTGWQLHRVWSPVFFRDAQRVLNGIAQRSVEIAEAEPSVDELD